MSTLPHPETSSSCHVTLGLSFVSEAVALPRCELWKGDQDGTGDVSPVIYIMYWRLLQASSPCTEKSVGCAKNHKLPDATAIVLFTRAGGVCAPWAELPGLPEGGCGSAVGCSRGVSQSCGALSPGAVRISV